jgi:hypothetical protein
MENISIRQKLQQMTINARLQNLLELIDQKCCEEAEKGNTNTTIYFRNDEFVKNTGRFYQEQFKKNKDHTPYCFNEIAKLNNEIVCLLQTITELKIEIVSDDKLPYNSDVNLALDVNWK